MHVFWGQSVHLSCAIHMPDIESMGLGPLRWYHYSREKGKYAVLHRREKYIHTADHGLVVLSVSERDAGRYDCKLGTSTLCSFNITVDTSKYHFIYCRMFSHINAPRRFQLYV